MRWIDDGENQIEIPEGAAITITTDCGHCDFICRASAGTKPCCDHPRIKHKRPYADDFENKGRRVQYDSRPEWCPLYTKENEDA